MWLTINRCLNFAADGTYVKAGFLVTLLFPYNRPVFPDVEFLSSDVTDRPVAATGAAAVDESNGKN
jgi:hypothetical protein